MRWRYHLGVHKTATTHLQKALEGQREQLRARGIEYIPLQELRPLTEPIICGRILRGLRFRLAIKSSFPTTVLSEENFVGFPHEACALPVYPNLEKNLRVVAHSDAVAFLSIRNPADFAASVYSQAMRHSPERVSLEETRETYLSIGSPWRELIDRIQVFFPNLKVWQYEDYEGNEQSYVSLVAGTELSIPDLARPAETQRLPAETIETLEGMRRAGKPVPAAGEIPPPVNPNRFEMFSAEERARLTRSYSDDVAAIRSMGLLV